MPAVKRQSRRLLPWAAAMIAFCAATDTAHAIPQFARKHNLQCTACHTVVPMLNARGQDFWQRGYRLSPDSDLPTLATAPVSGWFTGRQEDRLDAGFGEGYLTRAELISGGPVGQTLSYFIEWRIGSLESRGDGTLRDRSGRFEDAYFNWQPTDRFQFTAGQFRAINQIDISRRLSISEPIVFSTSLPGDPAASSRITSLRAFSPSGRQPGFLFQYQSIPGDSEADGLFHSVVLPFVGEWSIPLTPEAHTEASFESQGPLKGAFLETYYRQDLNSIGAHAFIDDDRWLLTTVATGNYAASPLTEDVYVTAALGWDDSVRTPSRTRSSVEVLYLPVLPEQDWLRPGVGFRAERVTGPGTAPAYIPFIVLSGPNQSYTFLTQIEYRHQNDNRSFILDVSLIF